MAHSVTSERPRISFVFESKPLPDLPLPCLPSTSDKDNPTRSRPPSPSPVWEKPIAESPIVETVLEIRRQSSSIYSTPSLISLQSLASRDSETDLQTPRALPLPVLALPEEVTRPFSIDRRPSSFGLEILLPRPKQPSACSTTAAPHTPPSVHSSAGNTKSSQTSTLFVDTPATSGRTSYEFDSSRTVPAGTPQFSVIITAAFVASGTQYTRSIPATVQFPCDPLLRSQKLELEQRLCEGVLQIIERKKVEAAALEQVDKAVVVDQEYRLGFAVNLPILGDGIGGKKVQEGEKHQFLGLQPSLNAADSARDIIGSFERLVGEEIRRMDPAAEQEMLDGHDNLKSPMSPTSAAPLSTPVFNPPKYLTLRFDIVDADHSILLTRLVVSPNQTPTFPLPPSNLTLELLQSIWARCNQLITGKTPEQIKAENVALYSKTLPGLEVFPFQTELTQLARKVKESKLVKGLKGMGSSKSAKKKKAGEGNTEDDPPCGYALAFSSLFAPPTHAFFNTSIIGSRAKPFNIDTEQGPNELEELADRVQRIFEEEMKAFEVRLLRHKACVAEEGGDPRRSVSPVGGRGWV